MSDSVTETRTAPCGCFMASTDHVFTIEPCSLLCPVYLHTVAEAKRAGLPQRTFVLGDEP